ncbi:MAG: hypothetical protein OXT67_13205 [Zetaproteobacteria bacterium]|nr:hypothetical protein [Zetaproteobacteria bacterium]
MRCNKIRVECAYVWMVCLVLLSTLPSVVFGRLQDAKMTTFPVMVGNVLTRAALNRAKDTFTTTEWDSRLQQSIYGLTHRLRTENLPMTEVFMEVQKIFRDYQIPAASPLWEQVQQTLALGAFQARRLELARYLYEGLVASQEREVRALAQNALGVMAYMEQDTYQTLLHWDAALHEIADYPATVLNMIHFHMQHGDAASAKNYALRLHDTDTAVAQSVLVAAERLSGNAYDTEYLCESFPRNHGFSVSVAYTCAVYYYLNKRNAQKSLQLLQQLLQAKKSVAWGKRAQQLAHEVRVWQKNHQ